MTPSKPPLDWLARLLDSYPRVHKIVRQPLKLWRDGSVHRIFLGYARGMKWVHLGQSGLYFYVLGTHEYSLQYALSRLLKPGDVFYDVGAQAGFHTMVGASLVGPSGEVFAFEPNSRVSEVISLNIAQNHLSNVHLVEMAVGRCSGVAEFLIQGTSLGHLKDGDHLLTPQPPVDGELVSVNVITIDDFVRDHPTPNVIKIDVEGAELDVLLGAVGTLESYPPILVLELHSSILQKLVGDYLSHLAYEFYDPCDGNLFPIPSPSYWTLAIPEGWVLSRSGR